MSVLQSMQDGVRTTRDGAILEVTLDRPKANAIDLAAGRKVDGVGFGAVERYLENRAAAGCADTVLHGLED